MTRNSLNKPQTLTNTIESSDNHNYNSHITLFCSNAFTSRYDMMQCLSELVVFLLWESIFVMLAEYVVNDIFGIPMSSYVDILLCPVLAMPVTSSLDLLALWSYAVASCSLVELFTTFPDNAADNKPDFMLGASFSSPMTLDDFNPVDDFNIWDDDKFPYVVAHEGFLAFTFCFIAMSFLAGLLIQTALPSWQPHYRSPIRVARVRSNRARPTQILGVCQSVSSWLLGRCLPAEPALSIIGSSWLIIVELLVAAWVAKPFTLAIACFPLLWSGVLSGLRWDVQTPVACPGEDPITGDDIFFCLGQWLVIALRSLPAGIAKRYYNKYEEDSVRHFPMVTCPIAIGLIATACILLWQDKTERLVQVEHVIEETLLKDAIIQNYEAFLRLLINKTGGLKEVLVDMSGSLAGVLAQNKELLKRQLSLQSDCADYEKRCDLVPEYARSIHQYRMENIALSRENKKLQGLLDDLRRDADDNVLNQKIKMLSNQLTTLHQEVALLRETHLEREQQLSSLHQEVSAATSRAVKAEERADHLRNEGYNHKEDAERLRQENLGLRNSCEQLFSQNQTLAHDNQEAKTAVERSDKVNDSLRKSREATEHEVRSLRSELAIVKAQHDSCVHELGATKAELTDTTSALTNTANALREAEHRLAQLDPSTRDDLQVVHDQHKDNEARQLRDKLQQQRSQNILLQENLSQLENELRQLRSQATGPSTAASKSEGQSDAALLERLRNELKDKDEELLKARIQLSNAQMSRKGTGSSPFMPPQRRK